MASPAQPPAALARRTRATSRRADCRTTASAGGTPFASLNRDLLDSPHPWDTVIHGRSCRAELTGLCASVGRSALSVSGTRLRVPHSYWWSTCRLAYLMWVSSQARDPASHTASEAWHTRAQAVTAVPQRAAWLEAAVPRRPAESRGLSACATSVTLPIESHHAPRSLSYCALFTWLKALARSIPEPRARAQTVLSR